MARRPDRRPFGPGPYLRSVQIKPELAHDGYPFLPAVRALSAARFDQPVTFLAGENGSGKSTVIEALAIASGFSPQGGPLTTELGRTWFGSERRLAEALELDQGPAKPRTGFFLRAESFFNVAALIDSKDLTEIYGGRDLLAQSHGESFLSLATNRFGGDGLFIFDEPEAALSVTSQLAFLSVMHESATQGSPEQFLRHLLGDGVGVDRD